MRIAEPAERSGAPEMCSGDPDVTLGRFKKLTEMQMQHVEFQPRHKVEFAPFSRGSNGGTKNFFSLTPFLLVFEIVMYMSKRDIGFTGF